MNIYTKYAIVAFLFVTLVVIPACAIALINAPGAYAFTLIRHKIMAI